MEGLRQLAVKLKLPVYITDIRPGFVKTSMAKGEGQFWVAAPVKAADQIIYALKSKKSIVYITKRWRLIALILKLLPDFLYKKL